MITELKNLWREAFGDSESFMDAFFQIAYQSDRCEYVRVSGKVVCALYWFDVECRGRKMAYLYGVATDPAHRGQGLASALIEKTCRRLEEKRYSGVILVPGNHTLIDFYKRLGFFCCTTIENFRVEAEGGVPLRHISREEYALLRRQALPHRGVEQEGPFLELLESQYGLFAGEGFVFCGYLKDDEAIIPEFLGDPALLPGVAAALGAKNARGRIPGDAQVFSMYRPLDENAPAPLYFGLPLD